MSPKLDKIAATAAADGSYCFTSIAHVVDLDALRTAFKQVRKDGASGIDRVTWGEYEESLESNLEGLFERLKAGTYRAQPVRRAYIPKAGGKQRPIGIPTLEDKIVQRAYTTLLEAIYEQDFHACSHGFRRKRGCQTALEAVWRGCMDSRVRWVIDADIQSFFDTLDHAQLREFLRRRVSDGRVLRMIGKWLKAGALEDGVHTRSEAGTPQGGVISPLLANVYLHYVLDEWFHEDIQPRCRGRAFLIRYADDFVIGFEREDDARRVLDVLPKRFARFALNLHPEKTRLVHFAPPDTTSRGRDAASTPQTFDFLGFTHHWKKSQKGHWIVTRRTAKDRVARTVCSIGQWLRRQRHDPIPEQHEGLKRRLLGHYGYYGVTGNYARLGLVYLLVCRAWFKWLNRRSQRRSFTWEAFQHMLKRHPLPQPRIVHRYGRSPQTLRTPDSRSRMR